ncbi:MAG: D-aminoacyl-tRNA deacylase [Desulfobulbaceae bacterium]|nr:D-aminoacyl-tRNA deacylase [Desulfobulbaceae bacterium]
MRAVIQRVKCAAVQVDNVTIGSIEQGLLILLGVHAVDTDRDVAWLADKTVNLRIFDDPDGKMNLSLLDTSGSLLVVSQFTLYGDCRKGRRPSWSQAARPELAENLYTAFAAAVRQHGIPVQTGQFQAMMEVSLTNDGPVTLILDSHKTF